MPEPFDPFDLIKNFGFPVCMCLWFMLRTDRRLDRIAAGMSRLAIVMKAVARTLDLSEEQQKLLEDSDT